MDVTLLTQTALGGLTAGGIAASSHDRFNREIRGATDAGCRVMCWLLQRMGKRRMLLMLWEMMLMRIWMRMLMMIVGGTDGRSGDGGQWQQQRLFGQRGHFGRTCQG